ncbi:polysaccharide pyruvyl transferase family protein [Marinomonas sp. 2405UD66-6]|uniref:polysaccharide pyruvyl transferase family protein n=1 Tax=Marinomonas sp. 2405UD66-6 TaxID=3391834 RepID=UPI0039C8CFF3
MKIGVLTLTPKNNYGGILQATALCSYLENQGHEVVLIDKKRFENSFFSRLVIQLLECVPFQNIKNKRQDYLKTKQLKPFLEKNLPRKSREIVTVQDLQELVEGESFDSVIVGSDQVWRYQYIGDGHHNVFFLDFDTNKSVKKIAYAASFGKDEWEAPEHVAKVSSLLHSFDAISTREKSGVVLCKDLFGVSDAVNVLDPTMLIGAEFYDRFFDGSNISSCSRTIVTYILDWNDEKQDIITSVKISLEDSFKSYFKQVNLSNKENGKFYGVEEWLWNIKNAEFVITDSFHGMVFSILFKKQFIVIGNEKRGLSRFSDLLGDVGLSSRLMLNESCIEGVIDKKIDYSIVEDKISKLRRDSVLFINQ